MSHFQSAAVACLAALLWACGDSDTVTSTDTPEATSRTTVATASAPTRTTTPTPTTTSSSATASSPTTSPPPTTSVPQIADADRIVAELFGDRPPAEVVVAIEGVLVTVTDGTVAAAVPTDLSDRFGFLDIVNGHATDGGQVVDRSTGVSLGPVQCPFLLERDGRTLLMDGCTSDERRVRDLESGVEEPPPPLPDPLDAEVGSVGWDASGGTEMVMEYDAEANLTWARTRDGVNLVGDDDAGYQVLSTDGALIVYGDMTSTASPHVTRRIVVRSTVDGAEVTRVDLDGAVQCFESDGVWVVACGIDELEYLNGNVAIVDAVAVHLPTGEVTRVATSARLLFP